MTSEKTSGGICSSGSGSPPPARESNLISRRVQVDSRMADILAFVKGSPFMDRLDPKLRLQIPERQFECRSVGRVPIPLQPVAPASALTKGRELVLANDVCGKSIGICGRLSLGIGEDVHFAMGLLERLSDFVRFEPFSPGQDMGGGSILGMPNRHAGLIGQVRERLALLIHKAVFGPDAVRRPGFQCE